MESLLNLPDYAVGEWLQQRHDRFSLETVETLKAKAEGIGYGGDLESALHVLDRAALVAEALPNPLAMGLVWRGRANVLQFHERFEESLAASGEAAVIYERYSTPFDVAVARTVQVPVLGALERFDEAIELGLWIRPHFDRCGFTLGQARLAANLGQVYTWAWRLEEALHEYRLARRLYLQLERPLDAAWVLHNMGVAADQMDRLDLARQHYTRAHSDFVAADDVVMTVKTQFNLALLCLRQGQYEKALDHLAQARTDLARLPDSSDTAYVNLFEARVRRALNQPAQAERLLHRALATFDRLGRRIESAETLIEMGHLLAEDATPGNLARGLLCLEQAEAHLQHLNVPLLVAWVQLGQAEFLLRLERTIEAAEQAEKARIVFADANLSLRRAQAEVLLADCRWRLQPGDARRRYRFVLDTAREDVPLLAARCWRGMGRLAAATGDADTAEQAYGRAVTLLDTVRRSLRGHSHQAGFLEDKQVLADELLAALHTRSNNEHRILAWVEYFKARALADLLARQPPDNKTDAALSRLLAERDQLRGELDQQMSSLMVGVGVQMEEIIQRGPALAAQDAYRMRELSDVRLRLQEIEEQIARRRDTAYEWREGVTIDPLNVHRVIDEETVLVSYYTAGGQLYALTATQTEGDLQIHSLGSSLADVEERWWQARRLVVRPTSRLSDVQARLTHFWKILVAPLEHRLHDEARLLILPHRGLFHIPFAALYDAASEQYLVERWTLQLAPSATILERCQRRPQGTRRPLLAGYPGPPDQPGYLPGVEREAQALASLLPGVSILLGERATAHNVMVSAPGSSLVHLAGHAFYNSTTPLDSGMPLAGGGWLRASDLYLQHGHLDGSTVVLSGCSAGRGRPTGGDVLGLTSAFLYAGAVGIVAGLWRVDDAATTELMIEFYRGLHSGADTAGALCLAQLKLLRSDQYTPPYFWAPFGLSGDSRELSQQ